MKKLKNIYIYAAVLGAFASTHVLANDSQNKVESHLTKEEMRVFVAKANLVLPSPGEVLSAMNKENVDWSKIGIAYSKNPDVSDPEMAALAIGVYGADAFLSINKKDKKMLSSIIQEMLPLAQVLGIEEEVQINGGKIKSLAMQDKWTEISTELNRLMGQVGETVKKKLGAEKAVLIEIGGWIEGMRLITTALNNNYQQDATDLLKQENIADALLGDLRKNSGAYREATVQKLEEGVKDIRDTVQRGTREGFTKQDVAMLQQRSSDVVGIVSSGS
jgi:hypothetical protein